MYSKLSLRAHLSRCDKSKIKGKRDALIQSRLCHTSMDQKASKRLVKILAYCRDDVVTRTFIHDDLCILYGNKLCRKYRDQHHDYMIRSRLREIGRFIINFKQVGGNAIKLEDILDPENYDKIVEAINSTAGLNETWGKNKAPSTAYNLGLHLKAIASQLQSECIKRKDVKKRSDIVDLLCLFNEGFSTDINKTVMENQTEFKRQKRVKLPTPDDISALKEYLSEGRKKAYASLQEKFSFDAWKQLAGFTLIALQLFNRRRAGEIERITIKDYKTYEFANENDESFANLPEDVRSVSKYYARFYIRGKLNRDVRVIINREYIDHIEILLKYREMYAVPKSNPYVFGIPGRSEYTHLRACVLMRHYSKACGAKHPETLRGTELRKQVATACHMYNMPDLFVEDLANHLGHHVDIHKRIYRQSTSKELSSVVNVLLKALGETEEDGGLFNTEAETKNNKEKKTGAIPAREEISVCDNVSADNRKYRSENTSADQRPSTSQCISVPTAKRVSWNENEKEAVMKSFGEYIEYGIVPTYSECNDCQREYPVLKNRTPPQIKSFIANASKKLRTPPSKKVKKPWSFEERLAVRESFHEYLEEKKLPPLKKCADVIANTPILRNRRPEMLKAYINNQIRKEIRKEEIA